MLGIPVFDVSRLAIVLAKSLAFSAMVLFLNSKTPILREMLNQSKDYAFSGLSTLGTVDLGCVSSLIGLDLIMNSVLNSIFVAGTFYVSSVITILAFKYTIILFNLGIKV